MSLVGTSLGSAATDARLYRFWKKSMMAHGWGKH